MGNFFGDDACLAATGSRNDEKRLFRLGDGILLLGIEAGHWVSGLNSLWVRSFLLDKRFKRFQACLQGFKLLPGS